MELTFEELGHCVTSQANRCQSKSYGEKQTNESEKCTGAVCLPSRPETFVGFRERITSRNSTWNLILTLFKYCGVLREDTAFLS